MYQFWYFWVKATRSITNNENTQMPTYVQPLVVLITALVATKLVHQHHGTHLLPSALETYTFSLRTWGRGKPLSPGGTRIPHTVGTLGAVPLSSLGTWTHSEHRHLRSVSHDHVCPLQTALYLWGCEGMWVWVRVCGWCEGVWVRVCARWVPIT